jgi:hypothetical protein
VHKNKVPLLTKLTKLVHGAADGRLVCQEIPARFMSPECSLLCSKVPAIDFYPESHESMASLVSNHLKIRFSIILISQVIPIFSFFQVYLLKFCIRIFNLSCAFYMPRQSHPFLFHAS